MNNLGKMLTLLNVGEIDFSDFVHGTRIEFQRMAAYLARRWKPPEFYTLSDIEQELYLGAWKYVWDWEPTYGPSIARYVTYNAMSWAKRQLHKARGALLSGSPDRNPSRHEMPLTALGEDGEGEALMASILAEPPKAEEAILQAEEKKSSLLQALKACEDNRERYAVLAIREAGSLDEAGKLLYDDIDHRIALRLSSEEHADRFVHRYASAVAQRIGCVRTF